MFNRFEVPVTIFTDYDTAINSAYFSILCQHNGNQHVRTQPLQAQTNGQVERFDDTFKRAVLKLKGEGT